jgi:hypothetical protein
MSAEARLRAKADATKQSLCCTMDCFAEFIIGRRLAPTRWLAMTTKHTFAIPQRLAPGVCHQIPALSNQRARGCRAPSAPESGVCRDSGRAHTR